MTDREPQQQARDLTRVLDISRAMVATEDLDSLLTLIVRRTMELLDAERGSVFLYDPETNELISRVAEGVDELRIPADRGISGQTVRTGKTINVPDVHADPNWNPQIDRDTGFQTRNILSVPLFDYEGGLVGVLQVLNKRSGAFDDYDVRLAETLGAQAGVALQRARLIGHYVEKQQMQRAMKIAQDIQHGLIPTAAPHCCGFDIAGFNRPADETGGDTYDFFQLPDGRWMIVVADATGHGIGAALMIAETRAMLRAVSIRGSNVSEILRTVNDLLTLDLGEGRFVTCFCGLLDPVNGTLSYASAGHGPMIFYDRREDVFREVFATSLPLGIMEQVDFDEIISHSFQPGEFAVIITDGFHEAVNRDNSQFGLRRMTDELRRCRDMPAQRMIAELHDAVREFTAGKPQADDLTAVVIRRR